MTGPFAPQLLALVAVGGAVGSVLRYATMMGAARWLGVGFPWGTLAVNLVGSAAIGLLGASLPLSREARLLLVTGLLGGFTTFSAFALDAWLLWQRAPWLAVLYVGGSVFGGLAACALAFLLLRR